MGGGGWMDSVHTHRREREQGRYGVGGGSNTPHSPLTAHLTFLVSHSSNNTIVNLQFSNNVYTYRTFALH